MNIQEILMGGGGVLLIALTLIQITPVQINPWSAVARVLGKAINADVLAELSELKTEQQRNKDRLEEHIRMDDERYADQRRTRILRFNNELLREILHTKEEFIEVLHDIDEYERYCAEHESYPNNRASLAVENIKNTYRERFKNHDFLSEGSAEIPDGRGTNGHSE